MAAEPHPTTHRWQHAIQQVLRAGLILSALLIAAGLAIAIGTGQRVAEPLRPAGLLRAGTTADRVIALGLLVLAATPVLRVAALVVVWLRERDLKFVWLGVIVLLVLLASALTGSG